MIQIEKMPSGFLKVIKDGETYEKVNVVRLFPYQYEKKYIALLDQENKEITILKDLNDLKEEERTLLLDYLSYKYYMPEITKVNQVKEKMGFLYVDLDTTAGKKEVCIADFVSNIRLIKNKILSITDVEGNKYRISDFNTLDQLSKQKLDVFL
ncbi:DUF1854 domain-containing protein [Niameybacter massiliensis]|uniref:DUF1854 domain-containing protein n=1 Tax=Holtiella tumoricola TaxID=3018743 RepID=A0AA42DJL5_9FIRM|nr:DUF1854 domain-containing protein [Holtiella tumoricola]MDA3730124.1 DUF1854 domain-containing protein [Holtiella tumoricola]